MVETVLSSPKFQPLVERELSDGAVFGFAYVAARATVGVVIENSKWPVVLAEKNEGDADWTVFDGAHLATLGILLPP